MLQLIVWGDRPSNGDCPRDGECPRCGDRPRDGDTHENTALRRLLTQD